MVIGEDEEDIWWLRRGMKRGAGCREQGEKREGDE
jgi:hypothetical protein